MKRLCVLLCLLLVGCGSALTSVDQTPTTRWTPTIAPTPTPAPPRAIAATPPPTETSRLTPTATAAPPPALGSATPDAQPPTPDAPLLAPAWSYPIGTEARAPGDGFFVRHGFQVENTWFNPGFWHTGEDWYAVDGDTAGADVYAVADGEVAYVGSNYPGRVVILRHAEALFSMYGHLALEPPVAPGQQVRRGDRIGAVLRRSDDVPSHLHFEIRTFLTTREVNGDSPRYGFRCGGECPPGPGYWPIDAPELPSALGWLNPTHVVARRANLPDERTPLGEVIVVAEPASENVTLWAEVSEDGVAAGEIGELRLTHGTRYPLLGQVVGAEATTATSAESYRLWYRIATPGGDGWVQAAVPTGFETGSDGRASTVRFNLVPATDMGDG